MRSGMAGAAEVHSQDLPESRNGMALKKGTVVNSRWWIVEPIKSGGMGAVYKAMDMHFQQRVIALKEMLQEFSSDDTVDLVKRKFREEANMLAKLKHNGIPQVIDYFIEKDVYYIVMEFIEGDNLDKVLQEYIGLTGKPMPETVMTEYAIQICDVLEYLHSREPDPIIHRDIKPGNIILRKLSKEVILVDFGLARRISTDSDGTKTLVGTVGYAPLEQFKGRPEIRSDIYALGATMHHLLTGERPTPLELEPVETLNPEISPELAAVVNKAISEMPKDRFSSATEMKKALLEVLPVLKERENNPASPAAKGPKEPDIEEPNVTNPPGTEVKRPETRPTPLSAGTGHRPPASDVDYLYRSGSYTPRLQEEPHVPLKESPLYTNPSVQLGTGAALLILIIGLIISFLSSAGKQKQYAVFNELLREDIENRWKLVTESNVKMHKVITLKEKGQGFVYKNKGGYPLKKIGFTVEIEGDPEFFVFWGNYALSFGDYKPKDPEKAKDPGNTRYKAIVTQFPDDSKLANPENYKLLVPMEEKKFFELEAPSWNGEYTVYKSQGAVCLGPTLFADSGRNKDDKNAFMSHTPDYFGVFIGKGFTGGKVIISNMILD